MSMKFISGLREFLNKQKRRSGAGQEEKPADSAYTPEVQSADNALGFSVPGLDIERGLTFFDGDKDDYIEALQSFVLNTPDILDGLRALDEEKLPDYAVKIHGFKSMCSWICADALFKRAETLEKLVKSGDFAAAVSLNTAFIRDAEQFVKILSVYLNGLM